MTLHKLLKLPMIVILLAFITVSTFNDPYGDDDDDDGGPGIEIDTAHAIQPRIPL